MADGIQIDINATWKGDAAVSQATSSLGKLSGVATSGKNTFQSMATGLQSVAMSAVRNASIFASLGTAVGLAARQVYNFGKAGAEIVYTAEKFDRLSVSVGSTSRVFLDQLRTATKGTLSDFKLLQQGSSLLQLGLASDSNEAIRLSRVMTALGMNTNELTLALANQSKRRLDQLGLSLTAFNKIEDKLKDSGLTKEQIFKEAFLQTAEQTVMLTGNRADSLAGDYERISAATENMLNMAKETTARAIAPDVKNLSNILMAMNAVQRQDMAWTGNIAQVLFGEGPVLRRGVASDYSSLWAGGASSDFGARGFGRNQAPAQVGLSALQSYTAMAYAGRNLGGAGLEGGAPSAEAAPFNYGMLFEGALKITSQTEKYTDATRELNEQLEAENEKLDKMKDQYDENSSRLDEQRQKIQDIKSGISGVQAAAVDMGDAMLLANLAATEGTEELQIKYALASGEITQKSYDQQMAIMRISQALQDNKISADTAASAVNKVMSADGFTGKMTMDIYINYIVSGGGGKKNQTMVGDSLIISGGPGGNQREERRAKGGPLNSPLTMVGEKGFEYIVQTADGQFMVVPHEASKWMAAVGIEPSRGMYTGGMLGEAGIENWTPTTSGRSVSATTSKGTLGSRRTYSGGSTSSAVNAAVSEAIPEITAAVGGSVEQTMAASPQLQALSASVAELKSVNETLIAILEKTASAGDIGRAVTGDMARQA